MQEDSGQEAKGYKKKAAEFLIPGEEPPAL
jgi:hypothetical protein